MKPVRISLYTALVAFIVLSPYVFPDYQTQLATLWIFVIAAMTWDMTGGQMGYNSLGNIFFYGTGMYVGALVAIGMSYDVGQYTSAAGGGIFKFTPFEYFSGFFVGAIAAGVFCAISALVLGRLFFGLRGPYFAIGTLGLAIAAGELVSNWDWAGGGQGISLPGHPSPDPESGKLFIYWSFAAVGIVLFFFLKWLYSTRFGAAINAIRDDEQKAEGMGIHTMRYKLTMWAISAFFFGIAGSISGFQLQHFEPVETAYQTINLGIFMVVCVLMGGKGTLWGPIIGAIIFQVIKETTWTWFLGYQWVALGMLIVITVVYFQDGLLGWMKHKKPEWFGISVEQRRQAGQREETAS